MAAQRWAVGRATITAIVEDETFHIPPDLFFPGVTATDVAAHPELVPDYADEAGNIGLRVQAFVVGHGDRTVLVDPCVGNDKVRALPFWHRMRWPWMERFTGAGFTVEAVDTVVHTHLHADHVGWDTHLADGVWQPTFTRARHLYTQRELDARRASDIPGVEAVYDDSIAPVIAAGLADIVEEDAGLGHGLRLEPTPGHTPGHVSLWLESEGETALITGDFLHHPAQCKHPEWAEVADADPDLARGTRRHMFQRAADTGALVLGTHFTTQPAGRITAAGDAWQFHPLR